jgi:hypothetical protein
MLEPGLTVNVPAAQPKHVSVEALAVGEYSTPMHDCLHSTVAAGLEEYLPAGQSVHAAEPALLLNFPAPQATHGPASGPVYPALQSQLL